jgi:anti-sigma regulatory factor (Ser/Thr protein kinase)
MTEIENIYGLIEKALRGESADAALVNLFKMAADEVFSNIVNYGFGDFKTGASVSVLLEGKKDVLSMTFRDNGKPFNPLTLPTPDTSLSVEERPAGGLGIHILKNSFDEVSYSFENGFNVLTLKKCVRGRGPK